MASCVGQTRSERSTTEYGFTQDFIYYCINGALLCLTLLLVVFHQLIHKLSVEAPPKILVERYLIEIAKNYNVPYEPDAMVRVRLHTYITCCCGLFVGFGFYLVLCF